MKYELIIFDLDGTILNTLEDLADSTNYALKKNNYPARSADEVRRFVGNGIGKLIERAVPSDISKNDVLKVLDDFIKYYKEHCEDKTKPYDGITEVIMELRKRGLKTAVVSNKADFAVQQLCKKYFNGLFDFVVGERDNIRRKPAPDSVNEVLNNLGTDKNNAVYVGDSEVDIKTANNAEMNIISVAWGFREKDFLIGEGAEVLVNNPMELIDIL